MTSIIIEFDGISGSGKTTLSCKVVQYLKDRGFSVISRDNTLLYEYLRKNPPDYRGMKWFILKKMFLNTPHFLGKHFVDTFYLLSLMNLVCRFEVRNPKLALMVLNGIEGSSYSEQEKTVALKMAYETFAFYQVIHEVHSLPEDNSIIVLDEGLSKLAQIIYAHEDHLPVEKVALYADQILPPDLIIHVDTEISICNHRLVTRGNPEYLTQRLKLSNSKMGIQTENCRLCTNIMCERLKSRNVPVYKVTNNAAVDSPIQLLQEYLDDFLSHKGRTVAK
jgi:thymidylate kinase